MNNTDNCPHCGAEKLTGMVAKAFWKCGNSTNLADSRTDLCLEREDRQKAEKEVEHYKQFISETVEACEPLRNIKGLELGQRISVEGVKLMIEENQKLRELLDGSLVALARAVKYLATEPKSSYEDALWRIQQQLSQITK